MAGGGGALRRAGALDGLRDQILLANCPYLIVTVSFPKTIRSTHTHIHSIWTSTLLFFLLFLRGTCSGRRSNTEQHKSSSLKPSSVVWLALPPSATKSQAS